MNAKDETQSPYIRLAAINVNEHTEKKNGLTYLSWAWAVDQLLRADPSANWDFHEPVKCGKDTWMVSCTVTAFGIPRRMFLPVMDHRNKAIADPDSFAFNTAMMRCLVKAIALHGLGLYIYAGEDLPEEEKSEGAKAAEKIAKSNVKPTAGAMENLTAEEAKKVTQLAMHVSKEVTAGNEWGAYETLEGAGLDADQKVALWSLLDSKTRSAIKAMKERELAGQP